MTPARRRRLILLSLAAAALVMAGWYGWWLLAGSLLQRAIDDWSVAGQGEGGKVEIGSLTRGGFPFSLQAEARDVSIVRADGSSWRSPLVVAEAPLWWVTALSLRLEGPQQITLPGGLPLTAEGGEGDVAVGGDAGFTAAHMVLRQAALPSDGATADRLEIAAHLPAEPPADGRVTGLTLTSTIDGLRLAATDPVLGSVIQKLTLDLRVQGAPPEADTASLAAWSRAGGSLLIDRALLHWGPVTVETTGTLQHDHDLQPTGTLTTDVAGFAPAVDALAADGWIRTKDVHTIKAVLTGLAPRRGDGAAATVRLPLSLHDRFVHVGPFRVMPLPAVVWFGGQSNPNQTTEATPAIRQ